MDISDERPVISVVSKLHQWSVAINRVLISETWIDQQSTLDWVDVHYPDHMRVSVMDFQYVDGWTVVFQMRHSLENIDIDEGRIKATHPVGGTIFRQVKKIKQPDGTIQVQYRCMDRDQDFLNAIASGIRGDKENNKEYRFALVRRSNQNGWNYYPLPLLFASRQDRIVTANQMGVRIPNEYWIRRSRFKVSNLLLDRAALNDDEVNAIIDIRNTE